MNAVVVAETHKEGISANPFLPDSVITDDNVYEYTFSDFDKAEKIMQELRKREKLPVFRLDIVEGDLYFNTGKYYRALKFYKRVLESDSVQQDNNQLMEQIHRMISCYDCLHDESRKAQYVDKLLIKAVQCGNKAMQSIAIFNMGKMLYYQGSKDRGYEYMQRAIDLMVKTNYKYKFDNLRYNYNTILIFQQMDRLNEAVLHTLEALQKVVSEETGNETPMEGLSEKEKKAMYAHYAVVLYRLGRLKEAENYFQSYLVTAKEYTRDNYLIMPYLFGRKMYDKVISMNSSRERILQKQGDTITYHMTSIKRSLGRAYEEKGEYRTAARYFKELAVLHDSIKKREQKSAVLELAAFYETQEKDAIIQKQVSDAHIKSLWLGLVECVVLLMGIILWCVIRYNRKMRFKNEALIENIGQLLTYKDELYRKKKEVLVLQQEMRQLKATVQLQKETSGLENITKESLKTELFPDIEDEMEIDTETNDERYGKELFEQMEHLIINKQLFLDPKFSGEKVRRAFGISRNRFAPFVKHYARVRFPKYLNNFRLEHAARLLLENPDYSIETIAHECGIPALTSFHRLFLERFGMTPMEFRKRTKRFDN